VAGSVTDTTIANKTLVIESSGLISGDITYAELEIKKGGSLQGAISKVGQKPQSMVAATPVIETPTVVTPAEPAVAPTEAIAQTPASDGPTKPGR
jgi:cytoskeletal protein CcmA (bactofilin family)